MDPPVRSKERILSHSLKRGLVSCLRNKFKKFLSGLKAFCSRRRPFWERLFSGAKSKELDLDPLVAGLGTQTAFDFTLRCSRRLYPKMLNGVRKNLSNLLLGFVTYLWDMTLEGLSEKENGRCPPEGHLPF
jgi:hypothetical protein